MKFVKWAVLFLSPILVSSQQVLAVWDFPTNLNLGSSYEGGTLAPANTGSTFFQNLLRKINFGGSSAPTQNTDTYTTPGIQNYQNTQTNQGTSFAPGTIQTTSYDQEYQKILKQNLGGLPTLDNTNTQKNNTSSEISSASFGITNNNQQYLTNDEIAKKFENFILQVNKIRSGYSASSSAVQTQAQQISVPQQTNSMSQQEQQQVQSFLNQNSMPMQGYSNCGYIQNPQEKQSCMNQTKLACQQGFLGGELLMPECSQLPISTYAGMTYGSQPSYSLQNFVNHDQYYTRALSSLDPIAQSFPKQYFNQEGNYAGPDWNIIGNATHYACTKKQGNYYPDNFLITTYKYLTAFGYKARYGTNVGDSTNSCNFQYCGVAVPLQFINSAYGSKTAAKNQLIQITNTANFKCTVAPIQDISAVKTFTHSGSNAVIDLSLCVMERINGGVANAGSIRVQYKPLKKGELGCGQTTK